jgi:hypothetical protein
MGFHLTKKNQDGPNGTYALVGARSHQPIFVATNNCCKFFKSGVQGLKC